MFKILIFLHNRIMFYYFYLFWKRMYDFKGKSNRKEFWLGILLNAIIMIILLTLLIISLTFSNIVINAFSITMIILFSIFCIIELLPSISLIFRRMHDIGLSWKYILVLFIPIIGWIWYLYLVTRPSNYFIKS